ncbi:MAG TPA: polyhydroxyalkanoic acid system family protein [Casimicrobiaceae bacterium]|nr:polyhydroxyalkanoic acid system family protein [Casimicrobiaceae bacterium]
MARLSITKEHRLTHAAAKAAAEKVAQDLSARFELKYAWQGDRIRFERPGLSGELAIGKNDVRLDAELGFLLSAFRHAIEREVHSEFDKRFGPMKA